MMTRRDLIGWLVAAPVLGPLAVRLADKTSFVGNQWHSVYTRTAGRWAETQWSQRLSSDTVRLRRLMAHAGKLVEDVTWVVQRGETVAGSTVYRVAPPRGALR